MSDKKGKVIHVNNLIIHAKNVEIVDPKHVTMGHSNHSEPNQDDHVQMRDPWGFFWGLPPREEGNDLEQQNPESR
jgi:hypothetical protein